MMNKKETPRLGLAKYLLVLPVIAALLSFNIYDASAIKAAVSETETVTVTAASTTPAPETVAVVPVPEKADPVYAHVDEMPRFPGGEAELLKWLMENVQYPESAVKDSIQGRVIVRYVIRPDGSIDDVQVVKSLDPACDEEAVRAVKAMPKWIPGKQNGKAISVYYNLPILFRLSKD